MGNHDSRTEEEQVADWESQKQQEERYQAVRDFFKDEAIMPVRAFSLDTLTFLLDLRAKKRHEIRDVDMIRLKAIKTSISLWHQEGEENYGIIST
mgnify:CR=1 FL=1